MLTLDRVDVMSHDLADAFAKLPSIITEIRDTVADREHLCLELAERDQVINTQNVLISDLRLQIKQLQDRAHDLVQHNAKLENVIMSAGRALASNESFQSAARELAAPVPQVANGHDSLAELPDVNTTG